MIVLKFILKFVGIIKLKKEKGEKMRGWRLKERFNKEHKK